MVSKFVSDIKYFFERLFNHDGKPLLMLSITGALIAVLEIVVFLIIIRNASSLNIPFLIIYIYFFYIFNRFLIRGVQFILVRMNIIKYQEDNYLYSTDNLKNQIRRYNSTIYQKERDRYEATIVYIVTLVIFLLIILTFVLKANNFIKIILSLIFLVPFILLLKEPYEIITIDVNEEDKREMTKKDIIEKLFDKVFKEKQISSLDNNLEQTQVIDTLEIKEYQDNQNGMPNNWQ